MVDVLVVEFMIIFAVIVVSALGTIGVVALADMDHGWFVNPKKILL